MTDREDETIDGWLLEPGQAARETTLIVPAERPDPPLVSCIMATHGRLDPARHAIDRFRRQTYRRRELVIACAAPESAVARHVADMDGIRVIERPGAASVGALRNAAIDGAAGDLLCVWDDDDLSHPRRLEWQVAALAAADAAACLLARVMLWWPDRALLAVSASRMWENSLLVRRDAGVRYPDVTRGGDTRLVDALRADSRLAAIDRPTGYCYVAHGANLWGDTHFEMLFAQATETFEGPAYHAALAQLGLSGDPSALAASDMW